MYLTTKSEYLSDNVCFLFLVYQLHHITLNNNNTLMKKKETKQAISISIGSYLITISNNNVQLDSGYSR